MYADVDVYVANDSKARNKTRISSTMMIMIRDRISGESVFYFYLNDRLCFHVGYSECVPRERWVHWFGADILRPFWQVLFSPQY